MKLSTEQNNKLKSVVGKRASAKDLLREICNEEQRRVLDYSVKGIEPLQISEKLDITLEETEEILDFLYTLDYKIRQLRSEYNKEKARIGLKKAVKENKRMTIRQKEQLKRELVHFKSLYKTKRISKSDLSKNLNKLNTKIKALGNKFEDRMFLAQVYADLDMIGEAEKILCEELYKKIDVYKETLYDETEKEVIEKRNFLFVKGLYEQGKSKEEIINIAEKESPRYRRSLKISFIGDVIKICDEEKRKIENSNNQEKEREL